MLFFYWWNDSLDQRFLSIMLTLRGFPIRLVIRNLSWIAKWRQPCLDASCTLTREKGKILKEQNYPSQLVSLGPYMRLVWPLHVLIWNNIHCKLSFERIRALRALIWNNIYFMPLFEKNEDTSSPYLEFSLVLRNKIKNNN